jgi:hypothetical protein
MYPGTNTNPIPATLLMSGNPYPSPVILTEPQREGIAMGTLTISIHGRIEYRDIFNRAHWLTFCYEPDLSGDTKEGLSIKIQRANLQPCIDDNDTDNN